MGPKKRPEKKRARSRKEESEEETRYYIARKGVKWRPDRSRCVVEMRPPQWRKKLHFGSHGSKAEAMVARDYGAFLRVCAGETEPDAGGFDNSRKLYYFEESPSIFESMAARTKERRASIILLYPEMTAENWTGNPPHLQFCKLARDDIAVAIRLFRECYPHRLTCTDAAPTVRVAPVSTMSLWANLFVLPPAQIAVAMDHSPRRILVDIQAPPLEDQQILKIFTTFVQGVKVELNKAALENLLHDLPPCTYDPASILAIDDS